FTRWNVTGPAGTTALAPPGTVKAKSVATIVSTGGAGGLAAPVRASKAATTTCARANIVSPWGKAVDGQSTVGSAESITPKASPRLGAARCGVPMSQVMWRPRTAGRLTSIQLAGSLTP